MMDPRRRRFGPWHYDEAPGTLTFDHPDVRYTLDIEPLDAGEICRTLADLSKKPWITPEALGYSTLALVTIAESEEDSP